MEIAGIADEGDRRILGERRIEAGKDANAIFFLHVASGVSAHGRRNDMRLATDAISDKLRALPKDCAQITGMALANAAQTDHENFHCALTSACSICPATHARF